MRFVFSPPANEAAGLLTLPWELPLADWRDDRMVEVRQRGLSRHVVRFVSDSGELYALKSSGSSPRTVRPAIVSVYPPWPRRRWS